MTNGFDWHCKKHNTFGDKGWSCSHCGYPLGVKNMELKDGELRILRGVINLFIVTIYIWGEIRI